jgi:hypothetical protein
MKRPSSFCSRAGRRASTLLAMLLALCAACGTPGAFATSFPVNRKDALSAALARARAQPRPVQRAVVVGVTDEPRGSFAYDIAAGRLLWKQPADVSGVPVAAGEFAVVPEGDKVRVRALDGGGEVLSLASDGLHLIGADGDGRVTAIVLGSGGSMVSSRAGGRASTGARSRLVVLEGRSVRFQTEVDHALGGPAVLGGLVFVPHNRVHLSILDAAGTELARVRVRDDVASQALAQGDSVYFGLLGMYRLDESTPQGAAGGASYFRMQRSDPLPGQPRFLPDTTQPPQPPESAVHRVALSFAPGPGTSAAGQPAGKVGLADDALYLLFYRQLYALAPHTTSVHWVHQTPADVVGVQAVPGGVYLVDEQGTLSWLDASGRPRGSAELGVKPVVARVRADRLEAGSGPGAAGAEPAPLTMQLLDAALNPDNRLVPARAMAVTLLAGLEDADATQGLIEICSDRSGPERVRRVACAALSTRSVGSEAVVAALARHADYLADTKAPPVGPLAEAALHSKDARAIVPLIAHLQDPETPVEELSPLMQALKGLADPSVAEPLADFLRLYHADAEDARMSDALVIAVETLAKVQGPGAQAVLEPIANDALGSPPVRGAAQRVLANITAATPADGAAPPKDAAKPATPAPAAPVVEGPPARLTTAHVDRALAPLREKLTQCVRQDPRRPMSARLSIVIEGDGRVFKVQTLPESLQACVEPLVRSVTFPATTWNKRDTLSTTLTR